jgi:hypothetical protein
MRIDAMGGLPLSALRFIGKAKRVQLRLSSAAGAKGADERTRDEAAADAAEASASTLAAGLRSLQFVSKLKLRRIVVSEPTVAKVGLPGSMADVVGKAMGKHMTISSAGNRPRSMTARTAQLALQLQVDIAMEALMEAVTSPDVFVLQQALYTARKLACAGPPRPLMRARVHPHTISPYLPVLAASGLSWYFLRWGELVSE